jgi:hypothetical protein
MSLPSSMVLESYEGGEEAVVRSDGLNEIGSA